MFLKFRKPVIFYYQYDKMFVYFYLQLSRKVSYFSVDCSDNCNADCAVLTAATK